MEKIKNLETRADKTEKNILLIGSNGLFGTAMERVCNEKNIMLKGLTHEDIELSDKDRLEEKIQGYNLDVIINSAALMGIPICEKNPKEAFEINSIAPLNLAKICQEKNIILIQISTNAVFDGEKKSPYIETDNPNPRNIYGLSKYAGEKNVQNNLEFHYIIRFPKLFGIRRNNTKGFTDKMMDKMRNNQELNVAGNRVDSFTYTIHAARKVINLLEKNFPFGIYHIANKGTISYYDFIYRLAEKIGYKGKIKKVRDNDFPSLAPNPLRAELSSCKITDMPDFEEAFNEYIKTDLINL